jgi:hypothetical protein
MASKKPLVITNGQIGQLQSPDVLSADLNEVDILVLANANAGVLVICTPVYISSDDHVDKAQADSASTIQVIGLTAVSPSIGIGGSGAVQKNGTLVATDAQWKAVEDNGASLVPGTVYYLDAVTVGKITSTPSTTAGQFVCRLGQAISTTEFEINIQEPLGL